LVLKIMKNLETGDIPRVKQPISTPTKRARKIQTEEYYGLIKWNDWDVERGFRFLNVTPRYCRTLLNKNRIYRSLLGSKFRGGKIVMQRGIKLGLFTRKT
jgi:hypothetical protein